LKFNNIILKSFRKGPDIRKRLFRCKDCGLEYNRDLNGAVNIGNRLLGYMLNSRGNNAPKGDFLAISVCEGGSPLRKLRVVH